MITAREIRDKAERKYLEVLQSLLQGENCFPLVIRSNKALSRDFVQMSQEIAAVYSASKDTKGFGYSVISEPVKTRQHGIQDIPRSIQFKSLSDYLKFLQKEKEHRMMIENYEIIKTALPQLNAWLVQNPKAIISNAAIWQDLLKVCAWFTHSFEPDRYYIRELPIAVHTKFIEENKAVLRLLLDELIPEHIVPAENHFEKRFRLKYEQPMIRFRSLDPNCWSIGNYDDLTVAMEQFASNPIQCKRVFIIENKMTFLTFPATPHSIAIWGKGFAIESLKITDWLKEKEIYYWSDLDAQGFQMLSQLRSYYPQVQSFLMEMAIVEQYMDFVVPGTPTITGVLAHLSDEESRVYDFLSSNNFRLEQERIHQKMVEDRVNQMVC